MIVNGAWGGASGIGLASVVDVTFAGSNVHRGRSMVDLFEHALRGVRLRVPGRRLFRFDRVKQRSSPEASELFMDLSHAPDGKHHDRRRVGKRPPNTLRELLTAMLRVGRSHAEKKSTTRRLKRKRQRT